MESLVKRSTNGIEHESYYQELISKLIEHPSYNKILLLRLGSRRDDADRKAFEILTDNIKEKNQEVIQEFIKWLLLE